MASLDQLTPEQRLVVETWDQGIAVQAGAGSGKTTTLVTKCVELMKRKPDARFAAVSFTERSASDLRAKLSRDLPGEGEGDRLGPHWVMTIHGLCGAIIGEYPREAGFEGGEAMLSEPEALAYWERALESLWFDELPEGPRTALDRFLDRENREGISGLLRRTRDLSGFGALEFLARAEDPDSKALAELSAYVMARYERLKRRAGAMDFNDLERGADRALEHERVREAMHRRFDLIMVDEFQDTNPLQARIIWRLVRPGATNLCVVGDPKQSIYRFRDADVSVFEEFCSKLPVKLALTWNFRSRPGIIDYANGLCEPCFRESSMEYIGLVPKKEPNPDFEPVIRLDVSSPADLARWIVSEVGRGVPLHEMALLLRKIRGNEKWLKALTAAGIPIAVGSGGFFWEDPRVRELVALLKWWDNPGNSLSGGVFLRAPWMGIPDAELDQWIRQDPTFQTPLFRSAHPIAQVLAGFRDLAVRPGELLLSLLVNDEVEAELGVPLLGLWHRVEDFSSRGLDFHAVVEQVTRAVEESRRERDVPPPRNLGQLCVLTLHASKGLEFKHVILVDLGKKPRPGDMPLLFWDRERGTYLGGRTEDGERDKTNPVEVAWREEEKSRNLAESKRVFYVALTRAKERLVLVCPELPEGKNEFDPEKAYLDDHWRAWVECAQVDPVRVEVPESGAPLAATPSALSVARKLISRRVQFKRPRHSVTEWNLLSRCPRAYEWTFIRPRMVPEGVPEIGLFTGQPVVTAARRELTQMELGSRVHSCLERGDFDGLRQVEAEAGEDRFKAEPVISWALSSDWMVPSREPEREVWAELAFEVPIASEVLVGSMDRVVLEDGRAAIIDFKITEKAKAVDALLEAYSTQLELYALALRRLEPRLNPGQLEAWLINLSQEGVQSVPVKLGELDPEALATRAAAIVDGEPGTPKPGPLCRHCDFRSQCDRAGTR